MSANPSRLLKAALAADLPVLLWAPPGVGKTASVRALAREHGAHVETVIGSQVDPMDVGGVQVPDSSGIVVTSPPPWARRLRAALDRGQPAWLFLDELSAAPPPVQAAFLRIVHERHVADVDLVGCRVVAAANPADTAADGGWLSPASANRWVHIQWSLEPSRWVSGMTSGWGQPQTPELAASAAAFAAYIYRHPAALQTDTAKSMDRAFPSPRSWDMGVRLVAAVGGAKSPDALAALASCVGPDAAAVWQTWFVAQDLPDPELVLQGSASLPSRGDQVAAASIALAAAAGINHPNRAARIHRAAEILAAFGRPDAVLGGAKALIEANDGVLPLPLQGVGETIRNARASVGR